MAAEKLTAFLRVSMPTDCPALPTCRHMAAAVSFLACVLAAGELGDYPGDMDDSKVGRMIRCRIRFVGGWIRRQMCWYSQQGRKMASCPRGLHKLPVRASAGQRLLVATNCGKAQRASHI